MPVTLIELAGPMLVVAALAAALLRRRPRGVRTGAAILAAALVAAPFGSASAAMYFLGTFGPLSAATLIIAGKYLYAALANAEKQRWPSNTMLICLVVIGAAFYPLTFGLTSFDPYEFGYRGVAVPLLILALVLVGWGFRAADILWWILIAALLYVSDAYGNRNLWDYLIVPFDPIFAVGALAAGMPRRLLRRVNAGPDQDPTDFENASPPAGQTGLR